MLLTKIGLSEAAIYSLVAVVMVFVVLLILIGVTYLIFKWLNLFDRVKTPKCIKTKETKKADDKVSISDEDMMVAVLVASIDYRNEIKKDVKVVSVKEIK
jgi:Na+-transporting methylmalonyl-CoA/oxaloacetate decarboxylase gamma subunit